MGNDGTEGRRRTQKIEINVRSDLLVRGMFVEKRRNGRCKGANEPISAVDYLLS